MDKKPYRPKLALEGSATRSLLKPCWANSFFCIFFGASSRWTKNHIGPSWLWKGLWTEAYRNHVGPIFFLAFFLGPIGDEQKSQRGQISHEKGSKKLRTGTHEKQIGPYALSTRLVTEWFLKPYFGFWPKWPVEKNWQGVCKTPISPEEFLKDFFEKAFGRI